MLSRLLRSISPAQLKKYGVYAILSFFISLSAIVGADDLGVRNADIKSERQQNEKLQNMLNEQYQLKIQQEQLLQMNKGIRPDTTKHEAH